MRISPNEARAILHRCGAARGADYHTLQWSVVAALVDEAATRGYRKPSSASGSTGRYFHAYLQRLASKLPAMRWAVSAGRWLYFDGKRAFALHRDADSADAVQLDSLVHVVCNLLNAADVTLDTARPVLSAWCDPDSGFGGVS